MNKIVDKKYCMSSYLALRYIYDSNKEFKEGFNHYNLTLKSDDEKIPVSSADEIDKAIKCVLESIDTADVALMLSGGIDSGILASYMPKGTRAYTVHNLSKKNDIEVERAKKICDANALEHVVIEVTWEDYKKIMDELSIKKGYPVFGNDPQIYFLAKKIQEDGLNMVIMGDDADAAFGGYDKLLSKDWKYKDFVKRFMFIDPVDVLKEAEDMSFVFEKYKTGDDEIDYQKCIKEVLTVSTGVAYYDMFRILGLSSIDPYNYLKMNAPLDVERVRKGESKYLLRELYKKKYPELKVPEKIPMARPMDIWMSNWEGPTRDEFIPGCIEEMTGEQKFNVYSLERFLNKIGI